MAHQKLTRNQVDIQKISSGSLRDAPMVDMQGRLWYMRGSLRWLGKAVSGGWENEPVADMQSSIRWIGKSVWWTWKLIYGGYARQPTMDMQSSIRWIGKAVSDILENEPMAGMQGGLRWICNYASGEYALSSSSYIRSSHAHKLEYTSICGCCRWIRSAEEVGGAGVDCCRRRLADATIIISALHLPSCIATLEGPAADALLDAEEAAVLEGPSVRRADWSVW